MGELQIERLGGQGAFGLAGSHLRSRGRVDADDLGPSTRAAVDRLFETGDAGAPGAPGAAAHAPSPRAPHEPRYRITRTTEDGPETVEVPESAVPEELQASVHDELA